MKSILESVKLIKDLLENKSDNKNDDKSTAIFEQIKSFENELFLLKHDIEIKQQEDFNDIQLKLKKLFNYHGVEDNLICQFITNIIDKDFTIPISRRTDLVLIFDKLTEEHIDKLVEVFGINKGWIYSQDNLYPYKDYYRKIESLITFILEKSKVEKLEGFAFKTGNFNYLEENNYQPLYIFIRTPITTIYRKTIYRYYPIQTDWKWNYRETRYQIKSLFNIFETPNCYIDFNGRTVTMDELNFISSTNNCPDVILRDKVQNTWYPYDYATKIENNSEAIELDEIQNIIDYMEKHGYKTPLASAYADL